MPNDDWAKANAKQRGTRAIVSGEYERPLKTKKPKRKKKLNPQQIAVKRANRRRNELSVASFQSARMCRFCKFEADEQREVKCKDDSIRVGLYCQQCGKYVKWLADSEIDLSRL